MHLNLSDRDRSTEKAAQLLETHYGIKGKLLTLPGEIDLNFAYAKLIIASILSFQSRAFALPIQSSIHLYLCFIVNMSEYVKNVFLELFFDCFFLRNPQIFE